jgi:TonB family protein
MILSLFLPYIDISAWFADEKPVIFYASLLTMQPITVTAQQPQTSLTLNDWIQIGYWTMVALFLIRFIWGLSRVLILMISHDYQREGNLKLHRIQRKSTFSFFNHIFIQPEHWNKPAIDYILKHEQAHVNHKHSIDSIIAELILAFGWFNPFYYTYRRDLHLLHECQADQAVLNSDCDKLTYHKLLLNEVSGNLSYIIVNQFSYSLIKRRFKMISKNKQSRLAGLRVLLAIPAALALMVLFSFTSLEKNKAMLESKFNLPSIESGKSSIENLLGIQQKPVTKKKVTEEVKFTPPVISKDSTEQTIKFTPPLILSDKTIKLGEVVVVGYGASVYENKDGDPALSIVEKNPEFPGGFNELLAFLRKNVKYPKEAIENKVQGTVFVRFIVASNGKIKNAKILRGINSYCDEEALRVVNMMPDWIPGMQNGKKVSVMFQIPVKFQLTSGQLMKQKAENEYNNLSSSGKDNLLLKPDEDPQFPGGLNALMKFLQKTVQYPIKAQENKMTGTVFVQFIVQKTGEVKDAKIVRGICKSLDEEALRVVHLMPLWTPGKKDGKPINTSFCIPIKFQLQLK